MIQADKPLHLSGDRFRVVYQVRGENETAAREIADFIRVEQTIEFPLELVGPGDIRDGVVGQIDSITHLRKNIFQTTITYAVEATGGDLPQILNIIFGNTSFIPHIRVEKLEFPEQFLRTFKGPRFGREGIRKKIGIYGRPMVSTALKPMGLSSDQFAEMAYQCALGGIDIIKDDHGLSMQRFASFQERVPRIVDAIRKANQQTGYHTIYFANLSGPVDNLVNLARFAKQAGVNGLMLLPGLYGLDMFRRLAEDDELGLPMMYHPGFLGTFRIHMASGLSPYVLHGQLSRLCGADITIFPHYAGRFAPPESECQAAKEGTEVLMHNLKTNLPCPGGGVKPEFFKEMNAFYGTDSVFLVAGNLHRHDSDLVAASRAFRQVIETT